MTPLAEPQSHTHSQTHLCASLFGPEPQTPPPSCLRFGTYYAPSVHQLILGKKKTFGRNLNFHFYFCRICKLFVPLPTVDLNSSGASHTYTVCTITCMICAVANISLYRYSARRLSFNDERSEKYKV